MKVICSTDTLAETLKELKRLGFVWACGSITAEEIRKQNPKTKYFIIHCYFNPLTGKDEMQYESETWYKSHDMI